MSFHGSAASGCPFIWVCSFSIWCSPVKKKTGLCSHVWDEGMAWAVTRRCCVSLSQESPLLLRAPPEGVLDELFSATQSLPAARRKQNLSASCACCVGRLHACTSAMSTSSTLLWRTEPLPFYPEQICFFQAFLCVLSSHGWCIVRLPGFSCRDGGC